MAQSRIALLPRLCAVVGAGALTIGCHSTPSDSSPPQSRVSFVYVVNGPQEEIETYRLNETTGELTTQAHTAVPVPRLVAADPRGRFLYVGGGGRSSTAAGAARTPGFLRSYQVQPGTGELVLVSEVSLEGYPLKECRSCPAYPMQVLATDTHLYVSFEALRELGHTHEFDYWRPFRVDASSGALSEAGGPLYLGIHDVLPLIAADTEMGWGIVGDGPEWVTFAPGPDGRLGEIARTAHRVAGAWGGPGGPRWPATA